LQAAEATLRRLLSGGEALERFRAFVAAQGGDPSVVDDPDGVLPRPRAQETVLAPQSGFVHEIDALKVGDAARALGAGRLTKSDQIDYAAGVLLTLKVGALVRAGEPWAQIFAADDRRLAEGKVLLQTALTIGDSPCQAGPLVHGSVDPTGAETRFEV
jgi:thymidine phosphorylase